MFGDRLLLARKKAGYSMDGLVEAMDGIVTKQALSKYERGLMKPTAKVLSEIIKTLDVSLEFLMSAQVVALEGVDFRTKSNTSAKDRAKVKAVVIERLERYLTIEAIIQDEKPGFEGPTKTIRTESDAESFAANLREHWDLGTDPIPNLTALLEEKGLKIILLRLPEKVSGLTCFVERRDQKQSIPVIVVNQDISVERRRFTLAHELFHRLVKLPLNSELKEEKVMNHCAGAFLMPKSLLQTELVSEQRAQIGYQELISLKHRCGVSGAALLYRLAQTGIISNVSMQMAFRGFARTWRSRESEPIANPQDERFEHPERFERLCYHALAEGYISIAKAMELLQLPREKLEVAMRGPSTDADHR